MTLFIQISCFKLKEKSKTKKHAAFSMLNKGFPASFSLSQYSDSIYINICVFLDFPDHETRHKRDELKASVKFCRSLVDVEKISARNAA